MQQVIRQIWPLLLGMFLLMMANSLQSTLLGARGVIEAIDTRTMGYIMSAYFAGFLLGSRIAPPLIRRVGHVRVYAALGSILSVAFILYAAFVHPFAWIVLRLVVGFCYSSLYIVTDSWLNELSTNEHRGQALSLNMLVQMCAAALGQWFVNLADPGGYGLFMLITIMVSLSFLPVLLSISPTPIFEASRPMSMRELFDASPLACLGMLLLGVVFATLYGMTAIYTLEIGFSIEQTSYLVMAVSLGAVLTMYPIGWLSDRVDRRRLIVLLCSIGAVAAVAGSIWVLDFGSMFAVILIIGAVVTPAYSLLIALANDRIDREQMAAASAGLVLISGVGALCGPVVTGYAMTAVGAQGFFVLPAVLLTVTVGFGVCRMCVSRPVVADDRASYVPVHSATSIAAAELAYTEEPQASGEANKPLSPFPEPAVSGTHAVADE